VESGSWPFADGGASTDARVMVPDLRRSEIAWEVRESDPEWLAEEVRGRIASLASLSAAVAGLAAKAREAVLPTVGRLALLSGALAEAVADLRASALQGRVDATVYGALQWWGRRLDRRIAKFVARLPDVADVVELGRVLLTRGAEEGSSGATGATYADYLASSSPFKSGDSVVAPDAGGSLVYGPELLEADPALAKLEAEATSEFRARFRTTLFDGRSYPRHVEHLHHVPLEDIAWLCRHRSLQDGDPEGRGRPRDGQGVLLHRVSRDDALR
jgi:hypothetical protein